jgi:hypothetical protein
MSLPLTIHIGFALHRILASSCVSGKSFLSQRYSSRSTMTGGRSHAFCFGPDSDQFTIDEDAMICRSYLSDRRLGEVVAEHVALAVDKTLVRSIRRVRVKIERGRLPTESPFKGRAAPRDPGFPVAQARQEAFPSSG